MVREVPFGTYLIVVSRGYDYEGNRLKSAQKTVHPPVELKPKQREKWLQEQAVLFEREVHHTPEPVNKSVTLGRMRTEARLAQLLRGRRACPPIPGPVQRWLFTPMRSTRKREAQEKPGEVIGP